MTIDVRTYDGPRRRTWTRWRIDPYRRLLVVLAVVTLGRMIAAAVSPLTEDEAYYRLWSQHLAFGYYDHPPMVAWWIAAGRLFAGDTPLGTRLVAVLGTTVTSLLIHGIARSCGQSRSTSARAAIWYNATLLVGFGGHLIVPDGPSSMFWTGTLWLLLRARSASPPAAHGWWLGAGLAAGLAVLSKYSALFLAPGVLIWLVSSPEGRARLRSAGPWLCLAVAVAVASTNVAWNATHDWVSFEKQFGRAAAERFTPGHLIELVASQLVLLNPLLTPLAMAGVVAAVARRRLGLDGQWLLVAVTLPFAAYLALHSLHAGVQGHWPAPLYPGLAILAAIAARKVASGRSWRAFCVRWAAPTGATVSLLALVHLAIPATDWFGRMDVSAQVRGWPTFADRVEEVRRRRGAGWVGALSFGQVAMLDNAGRVRAPILQITERSRYRFLPPPPRDVIAGPGLVLDFSRRVSAADLRTCFGEVIPLGQIDRGSDARPPAALARLGLGPRHHTYALFEVRAPKVDIVREGCWEAKTLADSLRARAQKARP
jgi:4-amino-4-deoxy-L-arabinose transferase-like glycosyltransferase